MYIRMYVVYLIYNVLPSIFYYSFFYSFFTLLSYIYIPIYFHLKIYNICITTLSIYSKKKKRRQWISLYMVTYRQFDIRDHRLIRTIYIYMHYICTLVIYFDSFWMILSLSLSLSLSLWLLFKFFDEFSCVKPNYACASTSYGKWDTRIGAPLRTRTWYACSTSEASNKHCRNVGKNSWKDRERSP